MSRSGRSMVGDASRLSDDELGPTTSATESTGPPELLPRVIDVASDGSMIHQFIGIIEARSFLRESIKRSFQQSLPFDVVSYSSVKELELDRVRTSPIIVMISYVDGDKDCCVNALNELLEIQPSAPVILLSHEDSSEALDVAISHGAKGYIPLTMEFEIVVEAVRVVLAGGTYVPMDCVSSRVSAEHARAHSQRVPNAAMLTAREVAVVRAIQLGKSNKVIAHELNMTESTVKVHVRHIMGKLNAKNRTEVAVKSEISLSIKTDKSHKAVR
jgi:DNA-binding NarL/FixJ family response regulator